MALEAYLAQMQSTLGDADADVTTVLGGLRETTQARVWRGQVLVDWEPDEQAGGILLRPALVARLSALHAEVSESRDRLRLAAAGRIVASLSAEHAELVGHLGGAQRLMLRATLRFAAGAYLGGEEIYEVRERAARSVLLQLQVLVRPRVSRPASPHTSPSTR